ncbi:TonB-dependent receptor [Sphingomonas arantia]|uniref:TonB-dependent receptor n=1 Tax=Sphingomonas arantia TaxID=1460676 RepID=UPI0036D3B94B
MAIIAVATLVVDGAHAQNAVVPETQQPQFRYDGRDIVVTAQRRSEALSDVPMSVTAVSGQALRERGVNTLQDLAKLTPGLSYVESGSSNPVYSIRGIGFFDTTIGNRPAVSVYLDEVSLPFSIMAPGASLDLERVEVLKGPQGTLFGQNSTGGAINYIAAKPTEVLKAGVDLGVGRFNTVDAAGFVSGPITGSMRIRVAGRIERGGDWQRSYTRADTLGRRDMLQGRALFEWSPASTVRMLLNVNGFKDRGDTQSAQLLAFVPSSTRLASEIPALANYPSAPPNNRAADWDPDIALDKDNSFYQVSLRQEFDLESDMVLTSLSGYLRFDIDQVTDQDGTAYNNVRTAAGGYNDSLYQELRLSGTLGSLRWTVGGIYSHDRAIEDNRVDFRYSTTNFATLPFGELIGTSQTYRQVFATVAAFGSFDWTIADGLVLHGGSRWTAADLDYRGCARVADAGGGLAITALYDSLRAARGLAPLATIRVGECLMVDGNLDPGEARGRLDQRNLAWRAGIDWNEDGNLLVYANASRGYKGGSAPTINGLGIAQIVAAKQETVLAYEVGAKATLLDRRVLLTAAAFYYDYSDKQVRGRTLVAPTLLGALETLVNVPQSRIMGVEGSIELHPNNGLKLSVAGTWLGSKVTDNFVNYSILGVERDFVGNPFPYTPRAQVVGDAQYQWTIGRSFDVFAGGSLNFRSATTAGFGAEPLLALKSYALVDLRAGTVTRDGRWRLQVYGRNVFDRYYWTNVAKFVDNVRRYAGNPATYGVTLSLRL